MDSEENTPSHDLVSYPEQVQEAKVLMKSKLPDYITECFLGAGYDTLPVIADINADYKKPGNTLIEIEDYINSQYRDPENSKVESKYLPTSSSSQCKFMPGHCRLISSFVEDVKKQLQGEKASRKRASEASQVAPSKKKLRQSTENSEKSMLSLDKILGYIHQQVAKWQRCDRVSQKLRNLKENKEYEIKLEMSDTTYVAAIRCCLCLKTITLGMNMKSKKPMISNWTRHVTTCTKSKSRNATLDTYLIQSASGSCAEDQQLEVELASSVECQQPDLQMASSIDQSSNIGSKSQEGFQLALCAQGKQFESDNESNQSFRLSPP